jgi:RNA polymerase sigma-70 factor (family 1)
MQKSSHHREQDLLKQLKQGSISAFEQIFNEYWEHLYLSARSKLHSHDDAEEVTQAIFSSLWEQREKLSIEDLGAYLHASVKNRIINIIRSRITREKYLDYYHKFLPSSQNSTEEVVEFDDLSEVLEAAVNRLPEKSRKVFRLSRMEGRSNTEIANLLKVSEKAIEYHLTKSLRAIRVHMKDFIAAWVFFTLF